MARAGAVWVSVLPDMSAWGTTLRTGLRTNMATLGQSAGRDYGRAMSSGVASGLTGTRAAVKAEVDAAALAVREAATKVAAARDIEAKAAGNVRVAELKLQETRDKAGASASAVAAAEERLATANRSEAAAAGKAAAAATGLADAQKRAASATVATGDASLAASGRFGGMGAAAETAGGRISASMAKAGKAILGLGALGVAAGGADFLVKGVENAQKFQASLTLLTTAGGESVKNLGIISSGLQQIAVQTGTSLDQLGEGMYTVEKAGIRGANGLNVLAAAAKGAKAENVDLATFTGALTSVMTSYGKAAGTPVQVTNELIAASGRAKTTMQEFAGSLQAVLPVASAAHISFAQVGGAVATLTQHGTSADEATQHLAFTIRALQAPNAVASKAMAQLGIASNDVATGLGTRGLQGTIDMLSNTILSKMGPSGTVLLNTFNQSKVAAADADVMYRQLTTGGLAQLQVAYKSADTGQKVVSESLADLVKGLKDGSLSYQDYKLAISDLTPYQRSLATQYVSTSNAAHGFQAALKAGTPQAVTYTAELKAMLGGAVGLNTGLQLTGSTSSLLTANIKAIGAAAANTSGNVTTWAATQATFNVKLDQFRQSVTVAGVQLGTKLLPQLTAFVGGLTSAIPTITAVASGIGRAVSANKGWLGPATAGILSAVVAYKALTFVMQGVNVVLGAGRALQAAYARATGEATVAQDAENVAVKANPLGLLATAIGAAVTVLTLWHSHTAAQKAAVDSLTDSIIADNGAIGQGTKDQVVHQLTMDGTLAKYQQLGISIPLVTSAYLGNTAAARQLSAELKFITSEATQGAATNGEYGQSINTVSAETVRQSQLARQLAGQLGGASSSMSAARQQALLYEQGLKGTTGSMAKASGAAQALTKNLADIPNRTVTITLDEGDVAARLKAFASLGGTPSAGQAPHAATGGLITGPGGPKADIIPAWLSNGEYVINAAATAKHRPLVEAINRDGQHLASGGPVMAGPHWTMAIDSDPLAAAVRKAATSGGGGNGAASPGSSAGAAQSYARSQLGRFGWDASQMAPLIALWNQESGWNYRATNPSSGAYGIPQSLPASKMASAGADYLTNPATQINWGLDYIRGRYGSPAGAEAHELSSHWYANGGPISGAGGPRSDSIPAWLSNGEYVINAAATAKHRSLLDAVNATGYAAGGPVTPNDGSGILRLVRQGIVMSEYLRQNAAYSAKIAADTAKMKVDQAKVANYTARLANAQSKLSSDQQASAQYSSSLASSLTGAAGIGGIFSTLQAANQAKAAAQNAAAQAKAAAQSTAAQAATYPQALGATGSVTAGLAGLLGGHTVGALPTAAIPGHTVTAKTISAAPVTARSILTGLKSQLYQIVTFQKALNSLKKRGIAPSILDQIAQAGVADGLPVAKALLAGSASDLAGINSAQAAITKYSQAVGNSVAQAIYGPTIKADQQAVASLTASLAKWTAALKATTADLAKQKADLNETPAQRAKAKAAAPPRYASPVPPRGGPIKITPVGEGSTVIHYHFEPKTAQVTLAEFEAYVKKMETKNRTTRLVSR